MSYWDGHAKGYSRKVEAANEAVKLAKENLLAMLEAEYPRGAHVQVVHHRGQFFGTVIGWDDFGARVAVLNNATGKYSKWWAAHVERIEGKT